MKPEKDVTDVDRLLRHGLELHNAGRLDEAKSAYFQILSANPQHAEALHHAGLALSQAGDAAAGERYLRAAAREQPKNWKFKANLAMALANAGKWGDALPVFKRALQLKPGEAQLEMGYANCLAMHGNVKEAEQQLRRITRRHADSPLAWFNLGNTLKQQTKYAEAVEAYEHALALQPDFADARLNLGSVLHALERLPQAGAAYEAVLALDPRHVAAHCNLVSLRIDQIRFAEAEALCRRALSWAPEAAELHNMLSSALGFQGRGHEALAAKRGAVRLDPANVRYLAGLGISLCEFGEVDEGVALLDRAHEMDPGNVEILNMRASAFLAVGRFREGWSAYAGRWARQRSEQKYRSLELMQTLPHKVDELEVNVIREQGIGDEIFFLRYAPALKEAGARITYTATPKIASVLERVASLAQVQKQAPSAGLTLMVGDLPYAVMQRLDSKSGEPVPAPPLPLVAQPDRVAQMKERLQALGKPPYIALTWRAGTAMNDQKGKLWVLSKEVPLERYAGALRSVDATFIAIQRLPHAGESAQLADLIGRPVHDLCALNDDLEDMLALMALADEYVAVSNTNIHLRAGLGRGGRVLIPFPAEWRWMARGAASPWFPGFALYRQAIDGSWSAAISQLSSDLATSVPARAPA